MRHGKKFNHLGRKTGHRKALLRNLTISLIEHKRINTTLAKAKALRKFAEPLITRSKTNDTHNRRTVFSYLQNKYAVTELFNTIAPKVATRPGGYLRIIKTGTRLGDGAEMAMIELVDFNDVYDKNAAKKSSRTRRGRRRRRRGGGSNSETNAQQQTAATVPTTSDSVDAPPATAGDEVGIAAGTAVTTGAATMADITPEPAPGEETKKIAADNTVIPPTTEEE